MHNIPGESFGTVKFEMSDGTSRRYAARCTYGIWYLWDPTIDLWNCWRRLTDEEMEMLNVGCRDGQVVINNKRVVIDTKADIQMAAQVIMRNEEIRKLNEEEYQVSSDDFTMLGKIIIMAPTYWLLWPLWQFGASKRWMDKKKRALWDFAGEADERKRRFLARRTRGGGGN